MLIPLSLGESRKNINGSRIRFFMSSILSCLGGAAANQQHDTVLKRGVTKYAHKETPTKCLFERFRWQCCKKVGKLITPKCLFKTLGEKNELQQVYQIDGLLYGMCSVTLLKQTLSCLHNQFIIFILSTHTQLHDVQCASSLKTNSALFDVH